MEQIRRTLLAASLGAVLSLAVFGLLLLDRNVFRDAVAEAVWRTGLSSLYGISDEAVAGNFLISQVYALAASAAGWAASLSMEVRPESRGEVSAAVYAGNFLAGLLLPSGWPWLPAALLACVFDTRLFRSRCGQPAGRAAVLVNLASVFGGWLGLLAFFSCGQLAAGLIDLDGVPAMALESVWAALLAMSALAGIRALFRAAAKKG